MYFRKIRHPSNFRFADRQAQGALHFGDDQASLVVRDLGEDVFHVELRDPTRWPLDARLVRMLDDAFSGPSNCRLGFDSAGLLSLHSAAGDVMLRGLADANVGVCGSAWMLQFARSEAMRFYGQGEKVTGLEKTGQRTKFWNLDVWGDHPLQTVIDEQPDPQYAAIPYLLIQHAQHWVGVLVDHPGNVFMDTGSNWFFTGQDDLHAPPSLWFGADQGVPAFYVIAGSSAASVTQRLQRLVGTTPLPPLWALGHHQCRWGYAGPKDLLALDAAFTAHQFPCDGLWLDIDYMDRYKVFTTNPKHFGDVKAELAELGAQGRRVVPILDPGVKVEVGYDIAQSGLDAGIYCLNPENQPYVGFVWPGRTWFPDYSLQDGRDWWADQVKSFTALGFHGYWIDMNDPSTGAAELDDMHFQRGAWPHWTYHNQYATGMAEATRAGMLAARPDERPFLLTRSAAAGSSRFTAMWTGDNWSNWKHLRTCIHGSLNLALSGMPFNGPDVPGFGGDATPELAIAWYKACCLFPFLRNHCSAGSSKQEPWVFGPEALHTIRHFVRLRYKLLPYIMQLWVAQEAHGSAVLRPLFHDFDSTPALPLDRIDDQFMVGPALMQAPLLHEGSQTRSVALPGPGRWMDTGTGEFIGGGQRIEVTSASGSTPMYLREGQLLPMQVGERVSQHNDLCDIELHVILGPGCADEAVLDYVADDGLSYGYQRGERGHWRFSARRDGDTVHVSAQALQAGWRPLQLRIVAYAGVQSAVVHSTAGAVTRALESYSWTFSGKPLPTAASTAFMV
jgi:alpha-glucosidase